MALSIGDGKRVLAGAVFACALALVGALLPAAATPAATEESTPASVARTIPVAPVDPASAAGRIVLPVADWLEQHFGSGSRGVRLTLDAPMWAEERDGTVILHLPGARLVEPTAPLVQWTLGDLAIAVTPKDGTAYDFETALPPSVHRKGERLTIGDGSVSGTWRSDLEATTRLEANAANLRLSDGEGSAAETLSVGALALADEVQEGADGLWNGRFFFEVSKFSGEGFGLGRLEASGSFDDFDRDLAFHTRGDFSAIAGGMSGPTALADLLTPLMSGRWGRSEMTIALDDLTATIDGTGLSGRGEVSFGRLEWRVEADGRTDFMDLATRIAATDVAIGGGAIDDVPPTFMPHAATIDIALRRLPLRRLAQAFSALAEREAGQEPRHGSIADDFLPHLDAADSEFELRDIRAVAPAYEIRADGRFQAESASLFGVIGRIDARIRGFDSLMALAVKEGEEGMVAFLIVLQGLGRPVLDEGSDEPFYAYEIDLRRDGAVTVNGIPFDMLLSGDLSLQ